MRSRSLLAALLAALSLPAQSAVGRLPAEAQVGPGGQMAYSVPFALPAGANGQRPALAAVYGGGGERGLLGVGWSLSGLSSISRCSKNRVNDPGFIGNIQLNSADALCLDGSRLLGGALNSATTYRTELQQFRKVEVLGFSGADAAAQPNGFKVTALDGSEWYYGNTDETQVKTYWFAESMRTNTPKVTVSWLLSKVVDKFGNTITYSYVANGYTGLAPDTITWSNNTKATPELVSPHKVVFVYEDDSNEYALPYLDVPSRYLAGAKIKNHKLIKAISIQSKDTNGVFVERRRYDVGYRLNPANLASRKNSVLTKRPLLANIKMCEGTDCVPATTFTWKDSGADASLLAMDKSYTGAGARWKDTDGWNEEKHYKSISYVDINGDGKTDVCGRSSRGIDCHLSDGAGFTAGVIEGPAWGNDQGWGDESRYGTIHFPDLNGDGRADVCGRAETGITCHLSLDSGFSTQSITGPAWSDTAEWNDAARKWFYSIRFIDMDGDGRTDVCGIGPSGLACHSFLADDTFAASPFITEASWGKDSTSGTAQISKYVAVLMPLDHNADGNVELCARLEIVENNAPRSVWQCKSKVPTGGYDLATLDGGTGDGRDVAAPTFRMADVNGDGFPDMCNGSTYQYICQKNLGYGGSIIETSTKLQSIGSDSVFDAGVLTAFVWMSASADEYKNYKESASNYSTIAYLDINKDGRADVCERTPKGVKCRIAEQITRKMGCQKWVSSPASGIDMTMEKCEASKDKYIDGAWIEIFGRRIDGPDWSDAAGWNVDKRFMTIGYADVNGDGYPEVCGKDADGIICHGLPDSVTSASDKIVSIVDGLSQETRISYAPLTNSSVYTKGAIEALPKRVFQPAAEVVSRLESSNGIGGVNATTYKYSHLVAHIDRGGQGFQTVEARDETTGTVSKTTYKQDFPFTGLVEKSEQFLCAETETDLTKCTKLSETANTWAQKDVMPAPYAATLPYLSESVAKQWDVPSSPAQ